MARKSRDMVDSVADLVAVPTQVARSAPVLEPTYPPTASRRVPRWRAALVRRRCVFDGEPMPRVPGWSRRGWGTQKRSVRKEHDDPNSLVPTSRPRPHGRLYLGGEA